MKIVDAHMGNVVRIGDNVPGTNLRIVRVEEKILSANMTVVDPSGGVSTFPLTIRYTHPSFFLQKVGFIPS